MFNFSKFVFPDIPTVIGLSGTEENEINLKDIISSTPEFSNPYFIHINISPISNIKNKNKHSKSCISNQWITKTLNTIQCNIYISNITDLIKQSLHENDIVGIIQNEVTELTSKYCKIPLIIILINSSSNLGASTLVKRKLQSQKDKIFNEENILLSYSENITSNSNIYNPLKNLLKIKIGEYFHEKKLRYNKQIQQYSINNNVKNSLLLVKYLIKEAFLFNENKEQEYRETNLIKAYSILEELIFQSTDDNILSYFKIRNICDFILVNIFQNKTLLPEDILSKLNSHFQIFDYKNVFSKKPHLITNEIILFHLIWNYKWYEYVLDKKDMRKGCECQLFYIHSLIRIVNFINTHSEVLNNLMISNENIYSIKENDEIGEIPHFKRNDNNVIQNDELIQVYMSYTLKKNFNDFDFFQKILIQNVKLLIKDCSVYKQSISKYNFLLFNAITLLNEEIKLFTDEEKHYFLYVILDSKRFILKKYPLLHQLLLDKYIQFLQVIPKNSLSSFHQKELLNKLSEIINYRKLNLNEQELLSQIFSLPKLEENFEIIDDSLLTVASQFSHKEVNKYVDVQLTVNISLNVDFIEINNIEQIKLMFSNSKKDRTCKDSEYVLKRDQPLSLVVDLLTNENDGNYLELEKVEIILRNGISIIKRICNDLRNSSLKIMDNRLSEDIQLIYKETYLKVAVKEYHVYQFEIIKNESSIETAITSIIGSFVVLTEDIGNGESNHDQYKFFYKFPQNEDIVEISDYLSVQISSPDSKRNTLMFGLKILEEGEFLLNFSLNITLSFLKFADSPDINTVLIKKSGVIKIESRKAINVEKSIQSNMYIINETKNNELIYPLSKPIALNYVLTNHLDYDICISNMTIVPSKSGASITTNLIKLLQRNKANVIKKHSKYNIPFIVCCSEEFSDSLGHFQIEWYTPDLKQYTNNTRFNYFSCSFPQIATQDFFIDISTLIKENELCISLYNHSEFILELLIKIKDNATNILTGKTAQRTIIIPNEKAEMKLMNKCVNPTNKGNLIKLPDIDIETYYTSSNQPESNRTRFIIHYNNNYLPGS